MPALLECSFSWRSDLERVMIAKKTKESGYTLEPNKNSLKALLGQFQGHPVARLSSERGSCGWRPSPRGDSWGIAKKIDKTYSWLIGNIYKTYQNIKTPQDWIATFLKVSYNKFGIVGLNQNWKFIPLFPIHWSFLFHEARPPRSTSSRVRPLPRRSKSWMGLSSCNKPQWVGMVMILLFRFWSCLNITLYICKYIYIYSMGCIKISNHHFTLVHKYNIF